MSESLKPTQRTVLHALNVAARLGVDHRYIWAIKGHVEKSGTVPNLIRPRTFNEKLLVRALRGERSPALVRTADKAAVRDFVRMRVGRDILNDVLHVGPDLDGFDTTCVDGPVVVKATHASGPDWIRIVTDPDLADWDAIRAAARRWVSTPYLEGSHEWWYHEIPPQVIVERFIGDPSQGPPRDHRFFMFDQEVELIQLEFDHLVGQQRDLYTPAWRRIDVQYGFPNGDEPQPRPRNLEAMIDVATRLSDGFDFVRVDLYDTEEGVKFGELTHCPAAGIMPFSDPDFEMYLGTKLATRGVAPPFDCAGSG